MHEACKVVIPALILQDVRVRSLVVGGKLGSRDVGYTIPKAGLLEERPEVRRREKMQREELQCQVENDTAEGPVAKDHEGSVGSHFGKGDRSFGSRIVNVPSDRQR